MPKSIQTRFTAFTKRQMNVLVLFKIQEKKETNTFFCLITKPQIYVSMGGFMKLSQPQIGIPTLAKKQNSYLFLTQIMTNAEQPIFPASSSIQVYVDVIR